MCFAADGPSIVRCPTWITLFEQIYNNASINFDPLKTKLYALHHALEHVSKSTPPSSSLLDEELIIEIKSDKCIKAIKCLMIDRYKSMLASVLMSSALHATF